VVSAVKSGQRSLILSVTAFSLTWVVKGGGGAGWGGAGWGGAGWGGAGAYLSPAGNLVSNA